MKRWKKLILIGVLAVTLIGCSSSASTNNDTTTDDDGKLKVTTTIGQIADAVKNVGGDHVEVEPLMGPGTDPHVYRASQGDIAKLDGADIIFYNGLNLEGNMGDILVKMAKDKPTIAVTEAISEDQLLEQDDGIYDPHVWFDLQLWQEAVKAVEVGLSEIDPAHEDAYRENAEAYLNEIEEMHSYVQERISEIPEQSRLLVTAHDAFGYFGDAYGLEVHGLQGISTDAEYSVSDVNDIVDLVTENNIKAVFIESSVSERAIAAVVEGAAAKGHELQIGGELFSDAMGEAGTEEGTYIGMVKFNVDTIVDALK
mgnify:CR=1 FL=1